MVIEKLTEAEWETLAEWEAETFGDTLDDEARETLGAAVEAILAARLARAGAKALEDAADHFDRYDEVTIGQTDIGSNQIPVEPAERLRAMAAALRSDANTEQEGEPA